MVKGYIEAFHTTNKQSSKLILNTNFIPSKKDANHWLGGGVYFYTDLYFAIQWGFIGVKKADIEDFQEFKKICDILTAKIDFNNYKVLDITVPDGYEIFLSFLEIIKKFYNNTEYEIIKNRGDAYIIKVLEKIEEKYNILTISEYDILFAEYQNNIYKRTRRNKSDFYVGAEKQICVKNLNAISDINILNIDSMNANRIFDIVKKNRGDLNDK